MASIVSDQAALRVEEPLSLDFTNTMDWHASERPIEELPTYGALLAWAAKVGLLSETDEGRLRRRAARQPAEAQAVLTRAHALREAIYRLMLARIQGQAADPADLERLNGELPAALARARLEPTGQGYTLGWAPDPQALDRMLWPIAYSAADLLTNPDLLERVGQCADDRGCGWLFLDLTKNRSRRWCAMRGCGNRAKAARHYQRRQGEG